MDILEIIRTIIVVVGGARNARALIRPEVAQLLEQIGDVHADAAKRVLATDLAISETPEPLIREMIGHLNAALQHQVSAAERLQRRLRILVPFSMIQDLKRKAFMSALSIACCYKVLQEEHLARQYFSDARALFYSYAEPEALTGDGEYFGPHKLRLQQAEEALLNLATELGAPAWPPTCVFREVFKEFSFFLPNGHEETEMLRVTELARRWNPPEPGSARILNEMTERQKAKRRS